MDTAFYVYRGQIRDNVRTLDDVLADVFGTTGVNMQLAVKWHAEGNHSVRLATNLEQAAADFYLLILLEGLRRKGTEWQQIGVFGGYEAWCWHDGKQPVFQVTKFGTGAPTNHSGYYRLDELLRRKDVRLI